MFLKKMNVHARCMLMLGKCYANHKRCYINSAIFGIIGGLTTQAPQAVAWAGSPAAMEGKARAQCTEASSTWHEWGNENENENGKSRNKNDRTGKARTGNDNLLLRFLISSRDYILGRIQQEPGSPRSSVDQSCESAGGLADRLKSVGIDRQVSKNKPPSPKIYKNIYIVLRTICVTWERSDGLGRE